MRMNYPEPMRGAEPGSFAESTMTMRLPSIARRVLDENDLPAENEFRMKELIDEMPGSPLRPLHDWGAPDLQEWEVYLKPYLGMDWLHPPWLFAEFYFYRRILEACGYFEDGSRKGIDPYALHKQKGLEDGHDVVVNFAERLVNDLAIISEKPGMRTEVLANLFRAGVGGNQADLSMWPTWKKTSPMKGTGLPGQPPHLLVDEAAIAARWLDSQADTPGRVDFILDNAAVELVHDLGLAVFLLYTRFASVVFLHLKAYPTYVSDATISDFHAALAHLQSLPGSACQELAKRLQNYLALGWLQLRDNPFWNAPLSFLEAPNYLREALESQITSPLGLVISKGDANYRRFLGDLHWSFDTPLGAILGGVPAPLLLLRVFKSRVAAGLPPELTGRLDQEQPLWAINGRWGVVQFHPRSII